LSGVKKDVDNETTERLSNLCTEMMWSILNFIVFHPKSVFPIHDTPQPILSKFGIRVRAQIKDQ